MGSPQRHRLLTSTGTDTQRRQKLSSLNLPEPNSHLHIAYLTTSSTTSSMMTLSRVLVLVASLAACLSGTSTAASIADLGKRSISIPLKHNVHAKRDPHWEYYRTLQKYNIPVPGGLQDIVRSKLPHKFVVNGQ